MPLSRNSIAYALACSSLWCALSAYWELAEIAPEQFTKGYVSWDATSEMVADWLLSERHLTLKSVEAISGEIHYIIAKSESLENQLIPAWVGSLRSAATKAHARFPFVDEDLWLYCYYCGFVAETVQQFVDLAQGLGDELSHIKSRYVVGSQLLKDLVEVYVNESQSIARDENIDTETKRQAMLDMKAFVTEAGIAWKHSVLSAVRDLGDNT